jgi:hypothetical protein
MAEEEVDYKALKEQRAEDREAVRGLKDAFSLNIGNNADRFIAILQGQYRAPTLPGEPDRITKPMENVGIGRTRKTAAYQYEEIDAGTSPASEPRSNSSAPSLDPKYAQIVQQLERYPFSDDEDRRARQMATVVGAIRTALAELRVLDVCDNTRRAFADKVKSAGKTAGGVKVTFNFGGKDIYVVAQGAFEGDETICVHRQNGKVAGAVLRLRGDNEYDILSEQFSITVTSQ